MATKAEIAAVKVEISCLEAVTKAEMKGMESRLVIKTGVMLTGVVSLALGVLVWVARLMLH